MFCPTCSHACASECACVRAQVRLCVCVCVDTQVAAAASCHLRTLVCCACVLVMRRTARTHQRRRASDWTRQRCPARACITQVAAESSDTRDACGSCACPGTTSSWCRSTAPRTGRCACPQPTPCPSCGSGPPARTSTPSVRCPATPNCSALPPSPSPVASLHPIRTCTSGVVDPGLATRALARPRDPPHGQVAIVIVASDQKWGGVWRQQQRPVTIR